MFRTPNAVEALAAVRSVQCWSRVVPAYRRLYRASLYAVTRTGEQTALDGADFLTELPSEGVRQVSLYSRRAYVPQALANAVAIVEVDSPRLWALLLQVLECGRCEATIDRGQKHEIRLSRDAIVAMMKLTASCAIDWHDGTGRGNVFTSSEWSSTGASPEQGYARLRRKCQVCRDAPEIGVM